MHPISPDLQLIHQIGFVGQIFLPAFLRGFFAAVQTCQLNEHLVVAGLGHHEFMIELF